ncbi:MAG: excinuclease ABC subunit UvrC [Defluviitaleaceae bacterium]|nr:excinuclease ABC subunit UvrC [Defluviitaleaceae bacterium]
MKNENDAIIYVGKAGNLKNRVRSYFHKSQDNVKTIHLVKHISHFEYVVTDTESEAFILENNLIKLHRPKFNIRLKDDKAYPYIKITRERLPRIMFCHKRGKDKAKYYGPFVSRQHVRELLDLMHRLWPLRKCSKVFPRDFDKSRPCLNHHISQCRAPCNRLLDEETYNTYVKEAEMFIQGKDINVMERLKREMTEAAEAMEFERAADLRDTISALQQINEKQKVETGDDDRDVIAMAINNDEALMQIYFVRGGKLSGREHYIMAVAESDTPGDILAAFIKQFYSEAAFIPKELSLVSPPAEQSEISAWLSGLTGRQVAITIPQKGEKRAMVNLAQTNAELTMSQFGGHIKREAERNKIALHEIADALGLSSVTLTRIEAYDISNIQGYESVGSMIVFENGKAKNSDYRKFRLKAVIGPDDYAGMEEVLTRRLKRYQDNHDSFSKLPDIIFVDGGKGQISTVEKVLEMLKINIPVCGMVKDDRHRTRGLLFQNKEAALPRHSEGFKLVTRIQDEVHRFALEYHKKLRADTQVRSILDDIPSIGATRRKELLKHFKNIEAIRSASLEDLLSAPSMNKKSAEAVYNFFNPKEMELHGS